MGSRRELERLYRTHGPSVVRRARAILGDEAEAREVLQDLFAGFVAEPEPLLRARSVIGFLYQATTHRCLNKLRNARTRRRLVEARAMELAPLPAGGSPEARTLAHDALLRLDDESAKAAIYRYVDGMSHAEIAALIGCSRRHVGNLLQRLSTEGNSQR